MDEMREKIRQDAIAETQRASKKKDDEEITDDWTAEQSQLLIKAVNLFPAGTASRYNCCLWRRPTIVIAHTFCASPDTRISYRQWLLIQGYFCTV